MTRTRGDTDPPATTPHVHGDARVDFALAATSLCFIAPLALFFADGHWAPHAILPVAAPGGLLQWLLQITGLAMSDFRPNGMMPEAILETLRIFAIALGLLDVALLYLLLGLNVIRRQSPFPLASRLVFVALCLGSLGFFFCDVFILTKPPRGVDRIAAPASPGLPPAIVDPRLLPLEVTALLHPGVPLRPLARRRLARLVGLPLVGRRAVTFATPVRRARNRPRAVSARNPDRHLTFRLAFRPKS